MRAELPWNVAGIPPEAREAARAAARREGLSVGEWLTRRILRSFSDIGRRSPRLPYDRSSRAAAGPLDPWGLPPVLRQPPRHRGDAGRGSAAPKPKSSDAYRRIEEHLRTVGTAAWIPPSAASPKTTGR